MSNSFMADPILLLLNKESDYFAAHFKDSPENVRFCRLILDPWNIEENEYIVAAELKRKNYSGIFITTGNVLLSYKFLRQITNIIKILFLTDDDWQFYEFSRHYGLCSDWIITTYKKNIELYKKHGYNNVFFSQWGVNVENFKPIDEIKDIEVSLIGAPHSIRVELAGYLRDHNIPLMLFGRGWEITRFRRYWGGHLTNDGYITTINKSKIIITTLSAGDNSTLQIKGRVFEAAACRAFQLVEYNPEMEEYFAAGEEIIFYTDYPDLKNKIEYYLKNDDERNLVAERAYQKVLTEHSWTKRLTAIFGMIEKKPKAEIIIPLKNKTINVVFIISQNETPDLRTINSLSSQLYKNIKIAAIHHSGLKEISADVPIELFGTWEELLGSLDAEYICFIENGDIWSEEKVLMQGAALKNDIPENIEISLSNYSLYENHGETKICSYSFSDGRRKAKNQANYVIVPSSIMLTRNALIRYNNQIDMMVNKGLLILDREALEYNRNFRIVNMQQNHVSIPLKRLKKRLANFTGLSYEFADFWHWSVSGRYALKHFLSRLSILSAIQIVYSKIKSKPIIHNYLTGKW